MTDDDVFTGYAPPDPVALDREARLVAADLGDRYEVTGFVARGGFATVWAATDRRGGDALAVKRLDPRLGRGRDFYRELRAMFVVEHPNVVRIVNVLETNGTRYLMLELCRGGSLRAALSKARRAGRKTDPRAARQVIGQIALGLAAVHARGFTHRDLKPENVLFPDATPNPLATGAAVKLADFGLTDLLAGESAALRGLTGSPAYMAPEQFSGAPTPASDVYALGVLALEVLTGEVPFAGTPEELARHHLWTPPPIPPGLPAAWAELLPAMMAKAPADRPAAGDVADRLGWGGPKAARPPTAETRPMNANPTADERAGLDREARRAKSALNDLAEFARPRRRAVVAPEPVVPPPEPPPPPPPAVSADGFFGAFESAPEPAAPAGAADDWFADEPAAEPHALADLLAEPPVATHDTVELTPAADHHTPPNGTPAPAPDTGAVNDLLDSFEW